MSKETYTKAEIVNRLNEARVESHRRVIMGTIDRAESIGWDAATVFIAGELGFRLSFVGEEFRAEGEER